MSYKPHNLREAPSTKTVTLLRSNNIRDGRLNFHDVQYVEAHTVRPEQHLKPLDIAVCMSNGNRALVGKAGQFDQASINTAYTVGAFCSIFRPTADCESDFVRYQFSSPLYQQQLDSLLAGSAINNLKGSDVSALKALVPTCRREQSKIAEVLSTVDRAIEQTEALIAKHQRIKTGLMQDLLTRGIDEHGNLRSEQTHEFKDSPLGRVPAGWAVDTLNQLTPADAPIGYGIVQPGAYDPSGVRVAGIYTINSDFEKWHMSSSAIEAAYQRSRIRPGDVLLSIKGSTGRVGVVPPHIQGNISREIARIRPASTLNPHFIRFQLLSNSYQRYLLNAEVGTTRAELSIKVLRELFAAVPPPAEQDEVALRLASAERNLNATHLSLEKLRRVKVGLMQDLLTGNRRVTALLEQREGVTT